MFYPKVVISFLICVGIFGSCRKDVKEIPTLITVIISSVTKDSVLMGGLIVNDGGAEITARGVCYGTVPSPKISGSRTSNGHGKGTFISSLTELFPNTLYYARAYATNSEGTGYGNEIEFKTAPGGPPVAATVITVVNFGNISYYYAWIEGRIKDDGFAPIIEKGICWSIDENPTLIHGNKVISEDTITNESGNFSGCKMDSLQPNSFYYVRAYAINSVDTSYGNRITIRTLSVPEIITTDAIEITGNSAKVGGQIITLGDVTRQLPPEHANEIETGICYGTNKDPSIDSQYIESDTVAVGIFSCNLINLTPDVSYFARAYVRWRYIWYGWGSSEILDEWVVYGNEINFITRK